MAAPTGRIIADLQDNPVRQEAACKRPSHRSPPMSRPELDEYEKQLQARIDESILRHIFSGLLKR